MMKVIIDTDLGCDCDDAAALAIAHSLSNKEKCDIRAITCCTSDVSGLNVIYSINALYHRENIPVGIYKGGDFLENIPNKFSKKVQEKYGTHFLSRDGCENAVKVIRRAYAQSNEKISLIGIGPLKVIAEFLMSGADEISNKTGRELAFENGGDLVQMACCFDYERVKVEWNVEQDIPSAQFVFENWPNAIYTVPFETGVDIITGKALFSGDRQDAVQYSYETFLQARAIGRSSWDPCTVLFAVDKSQELWNVSHNGTVVIEESGRSVFTEGAGKHYVVSAKDKSKTEEIIESLLEL